MKHLLRKEERAAVGDRYRDDAVFVAFGYPCLELREAAKTCLPAGEDLFYHCFCTVDELLALPDADARACYCRRLWGELCDNIDERWEQAEEADIRLAAAMIVHGTAELLVRMHRPGLVTLAALLKEQIEHRDRSLNTLLDGIFGRGFGYVDPRRVDAELSSYLASDEPLSEVMEQLMDHAAETSPERRVSGDATSYFIYGNVGCAGGSVGTQQLTPATPPQQRISNE